MSRYENVKPKFTSKKNINYTSATTNVTITICSLNFSAFFTFYHLACGLQPKIRVPSVQHVLYCICVMFTPNFPPFTNEHTTVCSFLLWALWWRGDRQVRTLSYIVSRCCALLAAFCHYFLILQIRHVTTLTMPHEHTHTMYKQTRVVLMPEELVSVVRCVVAGATDKITANMHM